MNLITTCLISRLKVYKIVSISISHSHHRCLITTTITVIRSRPNRHKLLASEIVIVTLFSQLMSPHHHLQPIHLQEFFNYMPTKYITSSSTINWPSFLIWEVRIWPYNVTHWAWFWNITDSMNLREAIKEGKRRR